MQSSSQPPAEGLEPEDETTAQQSAWFEPSAPLGGLAHEGQAAAVSIGAPALPVQRVALSRTRESPSASQSMSPTGTLGSSAGISLPPTHAELAADGLPVSGMRCAVDGGTFHCGACQTDSDCPAGKGCVANRETRRFECMESECEQDNHCFPGLVCRPVTSGTGGPVIRRCSPIGPRREGESCDILFVSSAGACLEGLVCHRGVCSAPCRPGEAADCPGGYTCEEGLNGAACFPDCRARGCPAGQQCKRLDETDHQCLERVQGECPETPCAEGEQCNFRLSRGRGIFWCARSCNPLRAESCPADQLCGMGGATTSTCYRRCEPMDPEACGEGWRCSTVSEDLTQWGCKPYN
jgi:hypothetical protein